MTRRQFAKLAALSTLPALAAEDPARLAADPNRPQYHLLPPSNWNNDPNGPIYWKGKYHMFYQHFPYGAYWNDMHWGHAVSTDMIHWKHLPIALAPTPGGPDKDGVFSGSAVIDNGVPTLVYTGTKPEVQMLATSDDAMIQWKKSDAIVSAAPEGFDRGFRDPALWKEGDTWYILIGSGVKGKGGAALLYRAKDLRKWEYMHPFCTGKIVKTDEPDVVAQSDMWECPDFFKLGNKHVLMVSTGAKCPYFVGTYAEHKFTIEKQGHTDFTPTAYASKTMRDAKGRLIYWSWVRERRSKAAHSGAGWASAIGLPRVLTLRADNTLGMEPLPELKSLRGPRKEFRNLLVKAGEELPLKGTPGDCIEIVVEFEPGSAESFGLKYRATPDNAEYARLGYDRKEQKLFTDTQKSSLSRDNAHTLLKGHFALRPNEPLKLQIFLDGSVVEMFANGRGCMTERVYPTRADSLGLSLFANGGDAKVKSVEIWKVNPISKDRLTS